MQNLVIFLLISGVLMSFYGYQMILEENKVEDEKQKEQQQKRVVLLDNLDDGFFQPQFSSSETHSQFDDVFQQKPSVIFADHFDDESTPTTPNAFVLGENATPIHLQTMNRQII
jgi:hypothetical protein